MTKEEIRKKTREDLKAKLAKYHKCALIRPTGFGKTFLLTDLIRSYKNVLYLYPADVIRNTVIDRWISEDESIDEETAEIVKNMKNLPNATLMSYMKLIRLSDEEFKEFRNYDLIIMDEVHRVGGELTKIAVGKLIKNAVSADIVGATATPNRMDGFDVISEFFDNVTTFSFTLHDAFQEGMLHKPYYCYCTYDIETDLKEAALTAGEDINNLKVKEVLDRRLIEISKIYNLPNVIKRTCDQYLDTSYMKFIIFFHGMEHLTSKKPNVIEWFTESYPNYGIRTLEISSVDSKMAKNVDKLDSLTPCKNTIDLIFCIDMLNMGYHVNNLSGIIMYRGTKSDIIYIQQLGRALSSGNDNNAIVFDIVDNLHRKGLFKYEEPTVVKPGNGTGHGDSESKPGKHKITTDDDGNDHLFIDGAEVGPDSGYSDWFFTDDEGKIKVKWWKYASDIEAEDLYATDNEATYRELIAKTVAEPMTQRCEEAFEAHFRRWCKNNSIPYPISDSELKKVYNLSKDDFVSYFKDTIKKHGIDYPMYDAKKLLEIGTKRPDGLPMDIFARWKDVSVSSILDLLGVAQ